MVEFKPVHTRVKMEKWYMLQKYWLRMFSFLSQGELHDRGVLLTLIKTNPFNIKHQPKYHNHHRKWTNLRKVHFKKMENESIFLTMICRFDQRTVCKQLITL